MAKLTIKQKTGEEAGTWVEFLAFGESSHPDAEAFVTVARKDDEEGDERVMALNVDQVRLLGQAMVDWANKTKDPNAELWEEFLGPEKPYQWHGMEVPGHCHCGLCGNSGIINTQRITYTAANLHVGVRRFCICPNGRAMLTANDGKQLTNDDGM